MTDEEKAVLKTAKENYGLTNVEQKILVNLIEKQSKEIEEYKECERLSKRQLEKQKNDIKTLEIEIEELKEDNKHQWKERCKLTFELENSTSNDKIKAKIEELERQEKEEPDAFLCKRVLQSLLEKE